MGVVVNLTITQIHLLDASSVTENLEALGPIIKAITESRQQEAFLRTVNGLVESKDEEIQKICRDNYLVDFGFFFTMERVLSHNY